MAISLPYTLQNGQVADATQVMANFSVLLNAINGLSNVTRAGREATGGGTIVGSATTDGVVVVLNVTTSATIYQLPASPSGVQWVTIKDGSAPTYGFQNYPCTVVTTDGSKIDQVLGATGIPIVGNGASRDFVYIGAQWWQI